MKVTELRVLLVDDDPYMAEVFTLIMNYHGITNHIVSTVEAAIKYLEHNPVTVIVIELFLPGLDGYQLMKRIRATSLAPDAKIVATSDLYPNRAPNELVSDDFDGFISKPFDVNGLVPYLKSITTADAG